MYVVYGSQRDGNIITLYSGLDHRLLCAHMLLSQEYIFRIKIFALCVLQSLRSPSVSCVL